MRKFFIGVCVVGFGLSLSAHSQSLQDEIKYRKEKAELEETMRKQQAERAMSASQDIKTNAFIVQCDPNYSGYYAFYAGKLYRAEERRGGNKLSLDSPDVRFRFEENVSYTRRGANVSWKGVPGDLFSTLSEIWELNLETLTMYRKVPIGTIYDAKCTLLRDNKAYP